VITKKKKRGSGNPEWPEGKKSGEIIRPNLQIGGRGGEKKKYTQRRQEKSLV